MMRLFVFATLMLVTNFALSQHTKDPGLSSKHASVAHHSASLGTPAATTNTNANATALARIEQQGAHAPSASAPHTAGTTGATTPKPASSAQKPNKPIKFSYKPPQNNNTPH